jgi:hypothetical protein
MRKGHTRDLIFQYFEAGLIKLCYQLVEESEKDGDALIGQSYTISHIGHGKRII